MLINRYEPPFTRIFLEEDAGGGSGFRAADLMGPVGDPGSAAGGAGDSGSDDGAGNGPGQGGSGSSTSSPSASPFDVNALAGALGPAIAAAIKPTQQQAPLTREEAAKLLNQFDVSDDFLAKFDNLDSRKQSLMDFRDGIVRNVWTMIQMAFRERDTKLDERFAPMQNYISTQEETARRSRFNSAYPDFSNPAFEPILLAVSQKLGEGGRTFATEDDAFKALADGVEAVIKVTNPNFQRSAASAAGKPNVRKPNGNPNALNGNASGAAGAAGASTGGGDTSSGKSRAVSLLPRVGPR